MLMFFFFSSRRRHTRFDCDWSSDVCSSDLPSLIGVLAAGYGDGIHRSLGNRGSVLVRGRLAPIVGIISMDVTMIDVTHIEDVAVGDVAIIYGSDGHHVLLANRVARSIGTVTSDLLCAVSQRVERVYAR